MLSINLSSFYGYSGNNNRVLGIASGLDTETVVEQMLYATKNKLNSQYQEKQKVIYMQEAYREIISDISKFQNDYFSYGSSSTNILSTGFFNTTQVKASSGQVSLTGNTSSLRDFSIDSISGVASGARMTSSKKVADESITSKGDIRDSVSLLASDTMTINYGGKDYRLTFDSEFGTGGTVTLDDVVDELSKQIEKQDALKDIVITSNGGMLEITSSDGTDVKLTAASNDILGALKLAVGEEIKSTEAIGIDDLNTDSSEVYSNNSNYITFVYNGTKSKINMSAEINNQADLVSHLQSELNKSFGDGRVDLSIENGKINISASGENNTLEIEAITTDLSNVLGIKSGDSNRLNTKTSLKDSGLNGLDDTETYQISINDKMIDIDKNMTIDDIIDTIKSNTDIELTYSKVSNTFSAVSNSSGGHSKIAIYDVSGNLAESLLGVAGSDYTVENGKDTEMTYTMNGIQRTVTRSTSSFEIDGVMIHLESGASTDNGPITFEITNNNESVIEGITKFIDDYNNIIETIRNKTTERPKRDFPPLTPEQKNDLEEKEIEKWEAEARKGVLYNDSILNSLINKMKQIMTTRIGVDKTGLSDIGIAGLRMDTSGKLVVDRDKLEEAISKDSDKVRNLFSSKGINGEPDGIAVQLQKLMREHVGISGSTGILIERAGNSTGFTIDRNTLSDRAKNYDVEIKKIQAKLKVERERHYRRFTALETAMNKLNSQNGMFANMF